MKTIRIIVILCLFSTSKAEGQDWLKNLFENEFSFAQKRSELSSSLKFEKINLMDSAFHITVGSCKINYLKAPFFRKKIRGLYGPKLAKGIEAYYSKIDSDQIVLFFFEDYLIYYSIITTQISNTKSSIQKSLEEFDKSKLLKYPDNPIITQISKLSFQNKEIKIYLNELKCDSKHFSFYDFTNVDFVDRIPFWCPVGETKKSLPSQFRKYLKKLHKKKYG